MTMKRREFLTGSVAAGAAAMVHGAGAQTASKGAKEFYQLRRYQLKTGPQVKLTEDYFGVLIPALNKMGMSPVGAFRLTIGPDTPAYYLLIPSTSVEALVTVDLRLGKDEAFVKAADAFWNAPAAAPAFARVESWLLSAFDGWPRVTPPSTTVTKAKRMFQLRTYESPSMRDHVRKVEMFHSGEFEFFKSAGAELVFFGDTLVGSHAPSLTYMLSFPDTAHLEADWSAFSSDPKWTKLKADPRFGFEEIVSNISNLMLAPLGVSQI